MPVWIEEPSGLVLDCVLTIDLSERERHVRVCA